MNKISRRVCLGCSIIGAAMLVAIAFFQWPSFSDNSTGAKSESAVASEVQPTQVFELRIYTAAPGKMEALHQRFRDHTLRLFEKHGIKNIGYWTAEDEQEEMRLYYLIAYPDRENRDKMLINGIAVDPEFRDVVDESEKDGKLAAKMESIILVPTDYSPLK